MNRNNLLFPAIMNDLFKTDWLGGTEVYPSAQWPAVNIKEHESGFELEVAIPGMKKEDFHVEVEHEVMSIRADVEVTKEEKEENYTRREFRARSFRRNFTLPETVDADKIQADYQDGILRLSLPKKEEALPKPKRLISIK